MAKVKLSALELDKLYNQDCLTDKQIAARLNCSDVAVSQWRKRYGIATVSVTERTRLRGQVTILDLSDETLIDLYTVQHKTAKQIGLAYGCSKYPVLQRLRQLGIVSVEKWERHGLGDLPQDLMPMLVGILLGDGSIAFSRSKRNRFVVGHSHRQYGYLKAIHERLGCWARAVQPRYNIKPNGRVHLEYHFNTIFHPAFHRLREQFYRDDLRGTVPSSWLKAPPLDVFRNLSWESLAYWYLDDGTLGETASIVLHYPLLNAQDVCKAVEQATGLDWVLKHAGGHLWICTLRKSGWDKFFTSILPWVTPDTAYKVPSPWREQVAGDVVLPPDVKLMSEERLAHYRGEKWRDLAGDAQFRWVGEILGIYRHLGFPFPRVLPDNETLNTVRALQKYVEVPSDGHVFRQSTHGLSLCNGYHPHRYAVETKGCSALKTYQDDNLFREVIVSQLKSSTWVTPSHMRAALSVYGGNRTPANWRPAIAKAIVDHLCPVDGVVWDPCAGFGGRLLGCLAAGRRYIGTEPSPQTVRGLRGLADTLGRVCGVRGAEILEGVAQRDMPDDPVDLVLTSPPYWETEKYVGGEQSFQLGSYAEWLSGFLEPMIGNAWGVLKDGGHLVLNIADVRRGRKTYPLVQDTLAIAEKVGFRLVTQWYYPLSRFGKARPPEPILVWTKLR